MKRKIIEINRDACNGCGSCINACHEGALQLVDGKAKLVSDVYCDGLGACLPECPTGAIKIVEREAVEFSEEAVSQLKNEKAKQTLSMPEKLPCGCPGTMTKTLKPADSSECPSGVTPPPLAVSQLRNWPTQIKLVPVTAPYLNGSSLLIAADCTSFAYPGFQEKYMRGKVTLIGCPKLDDIDYTQKLTHILKMNDIQKVTVVRMEVPCCAGIAQAVKQALMNSGKMIPWSVVTISIDGKIIDE
ncbi:MAG: 4Fe-4S dicluster domain-containing protein [bacterium]